MTELFILIWNALLCYFLGCKYIRGITAVYPCNVSGATRISATQYKCKRCGKVRTSETLQLPTMTIRFDKERPND